MKKGLAYGIRKSNGLHQHWTWKHGKMKPKKQFKTIDGVLAYMDKKHIIKTIFHPYICPDCGMWHIGHNKK